MKKMIMLMILLVGITGCEANIDGSNEEYTSPMIIDYDIGDMSNIRRVYEEKTGKVITDVIEDITQAQYRHMVNVIADIELVEEYERYSRETKCQYDYILENPASNIEAARFICNEDMQELMESDFAQQ